MGLTLKNNQLSISDSSKLNDALTNHTSDAKSFLDSKMTSMNTLLSSYVGTDTSFVTYSLQSMTDRKTQLTKNITDENTRLDSRQQALVNYYQNVQAEINAMSNTQSALSSYIYSSIYGTNKTG
jgi:flagellar capping protein FliD